MIIRSKKLKNIIFILFITSCGFESKNESTYSLDGYIKQRKLFEEKLLYVYKKENELCFYKSIIEEKPLERFSLEFHKIYLKPFIKDLCYINKNVLLEKIEFVENHISQSLKTSKAYEKMFELLFIHKIKAFKILKESIIKGDDNVKSANIETIKPFLNVVLDLENYDSCSKSVLCPENPFF